VRFGEPQHVLSMERFRLIRDLINAKFGIYFSDGNKFLIESRLSERISYLGLSSFDEYYHFLKYYPDADRELDEVVDIVTTNETYFFREDYQLRSFSNDILPELHDRLKHRRRLTIWSAGCSSGEEVYTIAMLALESKLFEGWDVNIFGNDISRRVLRKARMGVYSPTSFRTTSPDIIERYFTESEKGMRIQDRVRRFCHFSHHNILNEAGLHFLGTVDVIFCRNVLIYFDKNTRLRVISTFYNKLRPSGYLFLGHTESLINLSTAFELVHLSEDLGYRKPEVSHG
jgi:chemotaxis protein methyltransferase CheR